LEQSSERHGLRHYRGSGSTSPGRSRARRRGCLARPIPASRHEHLRARVRDARRPRGRGRGGFRDICSHLAHRGTVRRHYESVGVGLPQGNRPEPCPRPAPGTRVARQVERSFPTRTPYHDDRGDRIIGLVVPRYRPPRRGLALHREAKHRAAGGGDCLRRAGSGPSRWVRRRGRGYRALSWGNELRLGHPLTRLEIHD